MSKYRWVFHPHSHERALRLHDVGILDDGSLHNPNGYPEEVVRAAVLAADTRRHERRSRAAKEAAVTRARRQERCIQQTAKRIIESAKIGPRSNCVICGRGLGDPVSIDRGIGSECWQAVLDEIERTRVQAA
jgi:hypothetical protein